MPSSICFSRPGTESVSVSGLILDGPTRVGVVKCVEMRSLTPRAGKVWRLNIVVDTGRQWYRARVWIVAVKAVGDGNAQGSPPKQAAQAVVWVG
jgi:hypothetical protein